MIRRVATRPETATALRAAARAQRIADSRDGADRVTSKGGIDLVTATDLACEDAIRSELAAAFPGMPVIGEERGGAVPAEGPYWLVDPICGTRPFASQVPLYCTNVALVEQGVVSVAAIAAGRSGELLWAERGAGAWLSTPDGDLRMSTAADSHTLWIDGSSDFAADVMRAAILRRRWYVWRYSSSVSYLQLALGRIAGIAHLGISSPPMHTAAGCLAASEAGAIVTDAAGQPWRLESTSLLLAATTALHGELRELVESAR
jgi:myo-inositol-1(or 4)-monophosphatase